jgi:membrane-associated phospholipid phosphatase
MIFVVAFAAVFLMLWVLFLLSLPLPRAVLKRTAHWTASFRYRDYLPVAVVLAAGLAITAFAADGFLDIAELLHEQNPRLERIDAVIHTEARFARSPGATLFFTVVTNIGSPVGLGCIVVVVSIMLALRRRWRWLAYLLFTTGLGSVLNMALKLYYERARPDLSEAVRHASGYSFPSGHSMGTAIVFGAICYLATRSVHQPRAKAAVLALSATMLVAVAASRIYLGVHWISDVAAGLGAGLMWVSVTTVAYETFRRIRMMRALRAQRRATSS